MTSLNFTTFVANVAKKRKQFVAGVTRGRRTMPRSLAARTVFKRHASYGVLMEGCIYSKDFLLYPLTGRNFSGFQLFLVTYLN